ncbi:outer membrane OMP85 family protein [Striga asiatica]|uniref:Outer membrane OMP85 family protein n=1 Tax=Striga asiatica TaxID=4170 RepID=A0A5A7Q360_STRAF|nr:outer membrane OMP85 family protein [Striga asiatica]
MGAQKSIHVGNAKIDFNVDFTHKLCSTLKFDPFRNAGEESPLSLVIGSLCIKHPNLFGKGEKLVFLWDKGLCDSNIMITYRKPKSACLSQHAFTIQHSISPELGIHGIPVDNFSRSGGGGVSLSRTSISVDLSEPLSSNLSSNTSAKFEHVRPINDDGRSISRDIHGFPVTCSGGYHDNMAVIKQEFCYTTENDRSFTRCRLQIEQGIPIRRKWLIFSRLFCSLTSGSIVGDIAPYEAFSIGGQGSVRGYGEGAISSGQSCLVANAELTLPLISNYSRHQTSFAFLCPEPNAQGCCFLGLGIRYELRSSCAWGGHGPGFGLRPVTCPTFMNRFVTVRDETPFQMDGNPALRHGKPGSGFGFGYGLRFKSPLGHVHVDYAFNAFQQRTVYFGFSNMS